MRITHLLLISIIATALSCTKEKEETPEPQPPVIKLSKITRGNTVVNYEYGATRLLTKSTMIIADIGVNEVTNYSYDNQDRLTASTVGESKLLIQYAGDGRIEKTLSYNGEVLQSYRNMEYTDSSMIVKHYAADDTACIWLMEYVFTADKKNLLAVKSVNFPYTERLHPTHTRYSAFDETKKSHEPLAPYFGLAAFNNHPFRQSVNILDDGEIAAMNIYSYEYNEEGYVTKMMGERLLDPAYYEYIYLD